MTDTLDIRILRALIRSQQGIVFCLGAQATYDDRQRLRELEAEAAYLGIEVAEYTPPMPPAMLRALEGRDAAA